MKKRILLVDDDKKALEFLKKSLEREDYEVFLAYNGLEAQKQILALKPEVIVLDLIMPIMNGWQVLEWLRREAKSEALTIIVSAKEEMADMKKGYNLEADTYLVKPVDAEDLMRSIRTLTYLKGQ